MELMNRALPNGTMIHGRYRIQKELGEGGFGITYQAYDRKTDHVVALKEYMPIDVAYRRMGQAYVMAASGNAEAYQRFREKFLEEAKLIYRFRNHSNIVSVKHLFYENNTAYYVMEYLDGYDLGSYVKKVGEIVPWPVLKQIMHPIVNALYLVHQEGVVHCDISPDNIFMEKSGGVKLIDFGAAKNVMKSPSTIITLKKGFAPPEQFSASGKIGPWTDVYALAVTIYWCATGKMPPNAPDRVNGARVPFPSELGCQIPSKQWEETLMRGMELKIEHRYKSVQAFWQGLSGVQPEAKMQGVHGYFEGSKIVIEADKTYFLGTDSERCQLVYPEMTPGISHVHLRLWIQDNKLAAMDMKSRYGSFFNGRRMTPGLVYTLQTGDLLELASGQLFQVK